MSEQSIVPLSSQKDEDTLESERCWAEIPDDPLSLILQRVFLGDRLVCNTVCKSWNLNNTGRLPLPPPIRSPDFDSPCLMFANESSLMFANESSKTNKVRTWQIYHSLYNDSYYLEFPELFGAKVRYTKCGWLLMSKEDNTYFFFNPYTKVKIELPSTDESFHHMCFTSSPTSTENCVIFGIFTSSFWYNSEFGIINFGEEEWTVYRYSNIYKSLPTLCSPVFLNGSFYCLDQWGNVGVFNPNDEECPWTQHIKCYGKRIKKIIRETYMAEVDGEIWAVFVTRDDRRVGVYKLNLEEFVWEPLRSLRDKCLYVSYRVSFAENCDVKSLANKIYFNKHLGGNGVVYSLASEVCYSVGGGITNIPSRTFHGVWFKPVRDDFDA